MRRYGITPDVALRLAAEQAKLREGVRLVAPTLLKSQMLAELYRLVAAGGLGRKDAERRLDHLRGLEVRYLNDRVSLRTAWRIAERLGWQDTLVAEYLAVTELQADAFVTLDARLAESASALVTVASYDDLV